MTNINDFFDERTNEIIWDEKSEKRERFLRKNKDKDSENFFEKEFYTRDDDVSEIKKILSFGEEIKTKDIELVKVLIGQRKIKKKIGVYNFYDFILEITTDFQRKKVFIIRYNNESKFK